MMALRHLATASTPPSIPTIFPTTDDTPVLLATTRALEAVRNIFKAAFDINNTLHEFLTTKFDAIQVRHSLESNPEPTCLGHFEVLLE